MGRSDQMLGSPFSQRVNIELQWAFQEVTAPNLSPSPHAGSSSKTWASSELKEIRAAGSWAIPIAQLEKNKKTQTTAVPEHRYPPRWQGSDQS